MSAQASPDQASPDEEPGGKRQATLVLPLLLVIGLFGLLYWSLKAGDPQRLPSPLIGKSIPDFDLPPIPKLLSDNGPVPGLSSGMLRRGEASILNVWASWCPPCQAEHPQLMALARRGLPMYSLNYKDKPEDARRFLQRLGNPFRAIGSDSTGTTSIDFGVYGYPETFVIDRAGRVAFRYPGPLTEDVIRDKLMPALAQAR